MHTLLKGVAHTPEALKQHRNTLAMELLWIQQAIASRKKVRIGDEILLLLLF